MLNDIVPPRIDQETLPLYYDSDDDDNAPLAACGSRLLPKKRLLEEQYSIRSPSTHTKRSRQLIPDRYSSTFQNPQQEQDFKLAVELQHVENMAQGECDRGNLYEVANDDENTCHISTQATTTSISNDTDDRKSRHGGCSSKCFAFINAVTVSHSCSTSTIFKIV